LLVKSAQQMVTTAQDLRTAGINLPILWGGAALTKKFTYTASAAPTTASSAMPRRDAGPRSREPGDESGAEESSQREDLGRGDPAGTAGGGEARRRSGGVDGAFVGK